MLRYLRYIDFEHLAFQSSELGSNFPPLGDVLASVEYCSEFRL